MTHNNPYQVQYYDILASLLSNPDKEVVSRVGEVKSRFSEKMKIDLTKEFPLMDIKQTSFKNILVELLWFINGNTNIKYLVDNGCNIWNDDAFRWYNEKYVPQGLPHITKEEFVQRTKDGSKHDITETVLVSIESNFGYTDQRVMHTYVYGDLDIIYGRQWRAFGGTVDQLGDVIKMLKTNPDDRRMIITAHNPADIADGKVGLPSCHNYMQFYTQPIPLNKRVQHAIDKNLMTPELQSLADTYVFYKFGKRKLEITKETLNDIDSKLDAVGVPKRYISVLVNIRSNDFFLGNPYNIASYALLVSMIGQCVNMIPLVLSCEMVDCHLYDKHIDAANEWIARFEKLLNDEDKLMDVSEDFYCDARLILNPLVKEIDKFTLADCAIEDYKSMGKISAPLLT
jgi:thymidylate synthase